MQLIRDLEKTRDETLEYFLLDEGDLERRYAPGKWSISRRVYESVRGAIIYYAGLYYESKGHLEFVHSVTGVRTLKDEFDKVASHNEHHLDQIRLALQGGSAAASG